MTVIFLDVDGVITSSRDNGFRDFNIHVVHWLRWACEESGARIVISSTWRSSTTREFWQTVFGDVIHEDWRTGDGTRKVNGIWQSAIRGEDVSQWLSQHPEVTDYIILDDDTDFYERQKPHFIQCDPHNGMLFDQMMEVRDRLKIDCFPSAGVAIPQHPNMFGITRDEDSLLRVEARAEIKFT